MSAAFFIVLDQAVDFDTAVNGKALARAEAALEGVALELGVTPLMDFYSTSPEALPEEVTTLVVAFKEEWFTADDGLLTLRVLLAHLAATPLDDVNNGAVIIDLKQFEQVLAQAAAQDVRWHLEVDY